MSQNLPADFRQNQQNQVPLQKIEIETGVLQEMQETIDACVPVTSKALQTLEDSLTIANGLIQMRAFFQNPQVEQLVTAMKDTTVGFLTDRPRGGKKTPYAYTAIVEALIPCLLDGYRFTSNEINIIAGKGMPVKAGKFRKIIESDGVRNFEHTIGSPVKDGGIAKMKCQAKWFYEGQEQTIGYGDDVCIIPVEYDQYAGLDKLIGLAESKLFSRVLTRITGKIILEGDVTVTKDVTPESNGTTAKNIVDVEDNPQKTFVQKLAGIVDEPDYKSTISDLINSKEIINTSKTTELRSEDEETAERVYELIIKTKGFEESELKETA